MQKIYLDNAATTPLRIEVIEEMVHVLTHDFGNPSDSRQAPEIEHHGKERFTNEVLYALRIARSAIQMLTLSISQHERGLKENLSGIVGSLVVPDHDYIRGRDKK